MVVLTRVVRHARWMLCPLNDECKGKVADRSRPGEWTGDRQERVEGGVRWFNNSTASRRRFQHPDASCLARNSVVMSWLERLSDGDSAHPPTSVALGPRETWVGGSQTPAATIDEQRSLITWPGAFVSCEWGMVSGDQVTFVSAA